jgi:hypothetical protein
MMNLDYLDNYNVFCTYDYNYQSFKNYSMIVKSDFTTRNGNLIDSINCKTNVSSEIITPSGYFIAFNESLRPLTENMVLLSFKNNTAYPYQIQDVIVQYDLFVLKDPSYINMIVFTSPIKGTIPLNIYRIKTGINKGNIVLDYTGDKFEPKIMEYFSIPTVYVFKNPPKYYEMIQDLCIPSENTTQQIDECISNIKQKFEDVDLIKNEIEKSKTPTLPGKINPKSIYIYILGTIVLTFIVFFIIKN